MNRSCRQIRSIASDFKTRDEGESKYIEGYFSVFNSPYVLWEGAVEEVAPGAFANTLSNDVRALVNHDTTLVLGRNKAGTLELKEDSRGLWGRVKVNLDDGDAMNLYARVQRGDVDQCSFGFEIRDEEFLLNDDGSCKWIIKAVELYEVSVCTFPAYEETAVKARKKNLADIEQRKLEKWRIDARSKLKGVKKDGN